MIAVALLGAGYLVVRRLSASKPRIDRLRLTALRWLAAQL